MTLYDEIENDMNCFYLDDESDDEEEQEEQEEIVNELELAMRRKNTAKIFKKAIDYFESLDIDSFCGNFAIYRVETEIPFNLSDELLDEYKERYYDLISLGMWCDNVGIFPEMFIKRNIGMEKPLISITFMFTLSTYLYREGVYSEFDNKFTTKMARKLYRKNDE